MASTCPDCGEEIEFADREVRLKTGTCASCHHEFTLVAGAALAPPPGATAATPSEARAAGPTEGNPECADCGSPLAFRVREDGALEARCEECETTAVYVAEGARPPERGGRPYRERPAEGGMPPRGRPCRQCGAPLTFTTNEAGELVGECASCGNRFTLPARTGFGRGGGGRFDRGPPRGRRFGPPRERPSWGRGSSYPPSKPRRFGRERDEGSDRTDRRRKPRRRPED